MVLESLGKRTFLTELEEKLVELLENHAYIVAGTSGLAERVSPHPAMHTSLSIPGSLVLDVLGNRLDVTFIDECGEAQDHFTIEKS